MNRNLISVLLAACCLPAVVSGDEPSAEGVKFFETKIRPVLVKRCYQCHSADALATKKLEGELLLDTREGIRKGGESGPAVTPGDPKSSHLIAAIQHDTFKMPPDSKLPKETIADFVKWVEMGAPDPRDGKAAEIAAEEIDIDAARSFRSFLPLAPGELPKVQHADWVKNDIDRYILAPLEAQGIAPNNEAERVVLIRRLYFDVWGLPPTPAEVESFLKHESPSAYEQLVDRLLAGDHYGERWARHWLDLARFAESNGYAFDKDRPSAFHYRDFVIKALNEDMPYDRFVRLQIAGDQLEPANPQAHAATGFLAAGPFTSQQTQKERERSRYEQLDDVVGTIGTSMLGLTIGCARCHDHKYDPLPTRDYYRFTAAFAETGFQDFDYDPDPAGTKAALEAFNAKHKPLVEARTRFEQEVLSVRLKEWLASNSEPPAQETLSNWHVIGPFKAADFKTAFAEAFPPEKKVELKKEYEGLKWTPQPTWEDGKIHNTLTGDNSANYLYRTIQVAQKGPLAISLGRDDAIKVFLNGKQVLAKEVTGGVAADQDLLALQLNAGVNHLLVKIVNASGPSGFYFNTKRSIPKNIQDIINLAEDKRNDQQKQALLKWYAPRDPEWVKLNQAEQDDLKKKPQPKITKIFAARKNGATYNFGSDTRKVYFLARGNSNTKQGLASPGFLRVLTAANAKEEQWLLDSEAESSPARPPRVAIADWMTDEQQGAGRLLARVIVNRIWQHHFGRGLVNTPSNFGKQGSAPTHPELLDFLATELIANNWRLKPIHKLVLMSGAYRQSGATNATAAKVDPENRLWWRREASRLEAEVIRDTLFAVSGTLNTTMFGKGSLDQNTARRSIYLTVKRDKLIPFLQLFDAPDAIQSIGHRDATTVPPQALAMMNSPFVRQLAEKFASRLATQPDTTPEQIVKDGYQIALSRPATESEIVQMVRFMNNQTEKYGGNEQAQKRARGDFCQLVMCLNEFIFVD